MAVMRIKAIVTRVLPAEVTREGVELGPRLFVRPVDAADFRHIDGKHRRGLDEVQAQCTADALTHAPGDEVECNVTADYVAHVPSHVALAPTE